MRIAIPAMTALTVALLGTNLLSAHAAEARYYDPSNAASSSGNTTGYELYRTIGCPGKQLLDPACPVPPVAKPAPAPAPAPAPVVVAPKDSDGDGVIDDKDRCPGTVAGAKVDANGCELDGDKDGVVDRLDKCPTTPAGRKVNAQGCELDGDGDGVVDALDQCPTTPAGRKVNSEGCELDGDGDGVVDALDQCPTTPKGDRVDSKGCTLLNTIVLKGVNFDNDSAALRADATTILNDAVATLKRYPGIKVEIAGHTDSRSDDTYNQQLSEKRAKAVMGYFVANGVPADTLSAKGYGEAQPIADNTTEDGRFQNRRVELRILN